MSQWPVIIERYTSSIAYFLVAVGYNFDGSRVIEAITNAIMRMTSEDQSDFAEKMDYDGLEMDDVISITLEYPQLIDFIIDICPDWGQDMFLEQLECIEAYIELWKEDESDG